LQEKHRDEKKAGLYIFQELQHLFSSITVVSEMGVCMHVVSAESTSERFPRSWSICLSWLWTILSSPLPFQG
jgi:hypothetical protein